MYSIVMVAALTAAPATPDWCFTHGGCWGSSCCGGYGGWSCTGCCGGWGYGGCWGSSCCGGYGGCCGGWGCHGSVTVYSCNGCCGGWGLHPVGPYAGLAFSGCHGGSPYYSGCSGYGPYGPYASGYYVPAGPPVVGYAYPGSDNSVGSTTVMPWGPLPGAVAPAGPYLQSTGGAMPAGGTGGTTGGAAGTTGGTGGTRSGAGTGGTGGAGGTGGGTGGGAGGPGGISVPGTPEPIVGLPTNRGQVVVLAPANAKLYAEGQATTLTGTQRVFMTPDLSAGRDFQYSLKLESEAGTETRQVVVRAGHRTVVDFTGPAVEKAASPVTVNLPAKAKLFVDGVPATVAGGTTTFRTPELVKGKAFTYEFRAEVEKADGRTNVQTRTVTFKAGEPVSVDFTESVVGSAK